MNQSDLHDDSAAQSTPGLPGEPVTKPPKPRTKRAVKAQLNRIRLEGTRSLDRRTHGVKDLLGWQTELVAALGGRANISPQESALIESAMTTKAILNHLDSYVLSLPSLVNRRKRCVFGIVAQRQAVADSLRKILAQLGLEKRQPPQPTLQDFLRSRETEPDESEVEVEPEPDPETESPELAPPENEAS